MLVEICKDQCHAKVSIGGIDDRYVICRRKLLTILLLMPDFADNPCGRQASQQSLHVPTLSLLRHSKPRFSRPNQTIERDDLGRSGRTKKICLASIHPLSAVNCKTPSSMDRLDSGDHARDCDQSPGTHTDTCIAGDAITLPYLSDTVRSANSMR
jgi:hypothetical protein